MFENEEDDFGGRYEYETSGHINTKNYGNSCCDFFLHTNNTILNNTQNYQLSSENKFLMSVNISIMNWAVLCF